MDLGKVTIGKCPTYVALHTRHLHVLYMRDPEFPVEWQVPHFFWGPRTRGFTVGKVIAEWC